ncbi:hypothetical protein QBC34DRAFT_361957 [Podospora aff. communis PSN243]|uniref:Uncharacterized protein n=1 Tax=Podospora aff. communis PSN243 TaxID=3040156 RepID=A0AAV9G5C1_9PEZI|nr:hypothetical protein QBC34DRAFT_361957 [Podospora aff. communis PSN243]
MPPKRKTTGAPAASAKKSRASDASDVSDVPPAAASAPGTEPSNLPESRRSTRWAKPISGSANADLSYKTMTRDPAKAYKYELVCQLPFETDEDEEEEEEEESNCDGGETCLCKKSPEEKPDHPWKVTFAGLMKFYTQRTMVGLRDPDGFGMYTFNDHGAYGCLEVLQNLLLDFSEAGKGSKDYREQWAVCEGIGLFLSTGYGSEVTMIDDGSLAIWTVVLIGRLFLSMLARLEREKLLSKDSEVQNLGLIMGLFMGIEQNMGFELEAEDEPLLPKTSRKKWNPAEFAHYIVAYARKHDIQLRGPRGLEELVAEVPEDVEPPANTGKTDPFGFEVALRECTQQNAGVLDFLSKRKKKGTSLIGGDGLDITTWTPAERKQFAFDGKDPLTKSMLDHPKAGDVLQRG